MYFEIFLVYKLPNLGITWKRSQVHEMEEMYMNGVHTGLMDIIPSHAHNVLSGGPEWFQVKDQGNEAFRSWLAQGHLARKGEGEGWDLNPNYLKLDPEFLPLPTRSIAKFLHKMGFRKSSKSEAGAEPSQKALWINIFIDQDQSDRLPAKMEA